MTSDGTIKIGDFGLAVFPDGMSFGSQRGGNASWTPPENMWLQGPDHGWQRPTLSGDVYSFAITCVEVIRLVLLTDSIANIHVLRYLWGECLGRAQRI